MASPNDRRYLDTHEWHKLEGDVVTIGISRFAVDELTDVTYLEIAKSKGPIQVGESFGEVESVKATSDLYSGVAGTVVEVNQNAINNPAVLNEDPYEKGWLIKVKVSDPASVNKLMTSRDYDQRYGG